MALYSVIKSVFAPESWCCAIRFIKDDNGLLEGNKAPFTVVPNTKRYWLADPFIVCENDEYYLFFEAFDRLQKKGLLGYRKITENGFGEIKIIYEAQKHLSFPFIYKENNTYYIIPESKMQGELFRLKCLSFPDKWEKEKVLLNDKIVDTVIIHHAGEKLYLSQRVDDSNIFDRVDLFYERDGRITEAEGNPQKTDIDNARGAGRIINKNGMLIRPAQSCGKSYGEKLNFNEIKRLDCDGFEETNILTVSVNEINLDCKNDFVGIHTYNREGNLEVIDLKYPRKFNFYNFLGSLVKLFRKVFIRS